MQQGVLNNGLVLGSNVDNAQLFGLFDNAMKILFLLAFFMYVIFSFIALRQIHTMKTTLVTPFSGVVQILGYLHMAVTLFIFIGFLLTP